MLGKIALAAAAVMFMAGPAMAATTGATVTPAKPAMAAPVKPAKAKTHVKTHHVHYKAKGKATHMKKSSTKA